MADFGNNFSVKARKEHQCNWCYGPILKGEVHSVWKGNFDGEWQHNRMHVECVDEAGFGEVGIYEYSPGGGEMPDRVKAIVQARNSATGTV